MDSFKIEIALSVAIVILLALNLNPAGVFAFGNIFFVDILLALILLGVLIGLVLRERPQDERDTYNIMLADRFGYVFGVSILVLAVIVQYISVKSFDSWLLIVLSLMILAKLAGWVFGRLKS